MTISFDPSRGSLLGAFRTAAVGGGALLCSCGIHAAFAATPVSGGAKIDPVKGFRIQPLGGDHYWVTDGAYSTMFWVYSKGVIVCDAPPSLGANYLKAIAEVTDKPVTHLIYSHEHVDHIAGTHPWRAVGV